MRALIVSDIHGNLAALEAVLEEPHDLLVCLGDTVGFGPDPAACLRRLRRAGAVARVQGNHDASWAGCTPCGAPPGLERIADGVRAALRPELDVSDLAWLELLPKRAELPLDGRRTLAVHAAPSNPLFANLPATVEAWAQELGAAHDVDRLLVGHTHGQFGLTVGGSQVANPGSVGLPNDGAATAAYALLEDGTISLRRAQYDVEATIRRLRDRRLPDEVSGPLEVWLRTGRMPLHLLGGTAAEADRTA